MGETDWHSLIWIDGQASNRLPVTDRATQYGDGLFETIRWQNNRLQRLDAHLHRLERGCQRLQIPLNLTHLREQLEQPVAQLQRLPQSSAILKLIVTRGSGGRGYSPPAPAVPRTIVQLHPLPAGLADHSLNGIAAMQSKIAITENPCLAGMKHLNRLDSVLASQELATMRYLPGFHDLSETLLCNSKGEFIEGSRSNLFVVSSDGLITPELSTSGVAGVLRDALLGLGHQIGVPSMTGSITVDVLRSATEVFICNSVIGIHPVHTLYLQNDVSQQLADPLVFTDRSVTTRCQVLLGEHGGI